MNNLFEFLVLVETAALLGAIFFVIAFAKKACFACTLLDEVMATSDYGAIIFDRKGKFKKMNKCPEAFISLFSDGQFKTLTQPSFLDYLYDGAADFDESIRNTILEDIGGSNLSIFREVVKGMNGEIFLVEAKEIKGGLTLFMVRDISNVRRREANIIQLNTFNNQLMQAIQATTSGIIISDPKIESNPIIFANDAFCEFADCSQRDLIGADWGIVIGMIQEQDDKSKFIDALSSGEELDLVLQTLVDERQRYFGMRLTPVREGESLDLFIGVLSDVTLLKERESEVYQAQKLESLGQLAAGVAHDFNNILSIIGGYSVMAYNALDGERPDVGDNLKKIESAADRGASLTNKMLTFSRHKVISQTVINVCDVVREQQELLMPLMDIATDLKVNIPDKPVNMKGRADSVVQILMNFAVNARDAMEHGGTINIDVKSVGFEDAPEAVKNNVVADDYVCISVADTGTGMDAETVERIFDPFFSTKDQGKGTGLGLSVVYGLVKEMGGILDVVSVLGQGTTISFYAPLSHEAASKANIRDCKDLLNVCLDGYTILVVEDELDLLHLVTKMLEDMGLKVLSASGGDDALVMLDEYEGDVDILLTDVVMPDINGVKVAELVTSLSPDTKVIFMSGYPANGDMAPVDLPENATFVAKPMNYGNLTDLIMQKLREGSSEVIEYALKSMPYWQTSDEAEAEK